MTAPFTPPEELAKALRLILPWKWLSSPVSYGLEGIPEERPLLFVGNHTLYGIFDTPLMFHELYTRRGIFLRALGDHAHFKIPLWNSLLTRYGVVDGTRENCGRLMQAGEAILVFPGGGREVAKRKGEKYQLLWKERTGFARLAIEHRCTIIPFAALGMEDALDILVDADEIMASPLGGLLTRLGVREEIILPLVKGIGPTPLPRPERLYFSFEAPIRASEYEGSYEDQAACSALRDRVRTAVAEGITRLQRQRDEDPHRKLLPRLLNELQELTGGKK